MAITKIGVYRNPPEDITDYEAIVAHLEAYTRQIGNQGMILTEWTNTTNAPKIAMGSYISHGGVLYVVEDEDYLLPALSVDGTYYIRVAVSGATLVITYTTNIANYSWNAVYGGLYHADESQVIPYQVVKNGALIEKYKMLNPWQGSSDFTVVDYLGHLHGTSLGISGAATIGGALGVTGAISGAEITAQNKAVLRGRDMTYGFANVVRKKPFSQYKGQGIAYDGTHLYILAGGIVYRCTNGIESISVLDNLDLSGGTGIAWVGDKLVTCSTVNINVYDGYSSTLLSSFDPPGNRCSGLSVKNGNLVSIDYESRTIYEHVGVTSAISASINISGILNAFGYGYNLHGVCWTGENYIVSLGSLSLGYKYSDVLSIAKDNSSVYDAININEYAPNGKIAGVCLVGNGRIAIVGEEPAGQNYVYELLTMIR